MVAIIQNVLKDENFAMLQTNQSDFGSGIFIVSLVTVICAGRDIMAFTFISPTLQIN